MTSLGFVKCMLDNSPLSAKLGSGVVDIWGGQISPALGSVFGIIGFVPVIVSFVENPNKTAIDAVNLGSGLCSSTSGALSYLTSKSVPPNVEWTVWALSAGLTIISGDLGSGVAVVSLL
jgi:hypothetical protein